MDTNEIRGKLLEEVVGLQFSYLVMRRPLRWAWEAHVPEFGQVPTFTIQGQVRV